MQATPLCAIEGPPYTPREVGVILGIRDVYATLGRWRRAGSGPKFLRLGRKGARVLYPRAAFWKWLDSRTVTSEEEAEAAGC